MPYCDPFHRNTLLVLTTIAMKHVSEITKLLLYLQDIQKKEFNLML